MNAEQSTSNWHPASVVQAAPAPAGPVIEEALNIHNELAGTSRLIDDLFHRLDAVLQPAPPAAVSKDESRPGGRSELHGRLLDTHERVNQINHRIAQLLDRVTV